MQNGGDPRRREAPINHTRFFLVALIGLLSSLTAVRLYFRIVTGEIRERPPSKDEAWPAAVVRWIIQAHLFAATAIHILRPGRLSWMYIPIPYVLRLGGVLLGISSVYLIWRVHVELGSCFSSHLVIRENHRLVRTGPYRFVRHPMYSSYFLLFLGALLMSENWVMGLCGMAAIATLVAARVRREEALLLQRFGAEYREYRGSTGMLIPMTHRFGRWVRTAKSFPA